MSKKIYFKGREQRKDGLSNFRYLIEEEEGEKAGEEITVVVHPEWYDEEIMRVEKLDIPDSNSIGVLLRYIAQEAVSQYEEFTSGNDDSTSREIPPDRALDFNEIMNLSRGESPKVYLMDNPRQD